MSWLDALKGFAIVCVVIGHVAVGFMEARLFSAHSGVTRGLYNALYAFHMPLFFAVSGFLFGRAYTTGPLQSSALKKDALRRQVLNLVIVYVAYSLLMGVLKLIFPGYVNNLIQPVRLLLLWIYPIQIYWYIYVLVFYYLLFSVSRVRNAPPLPLGAVLAGLSVLSGILPSIPWFKLNELLFNLPFFYLGYCLEKAEDSPVLRRGGYAVSAIAAVLAALFWDNARFIRNIPLVNTLVAAGFVFLLFEAFIHVPWLSKSRILNYCGQHSLEVYLLHTYAITACRSILPWVGIKNYFIHLVLSTLAGLLLPLLVGWIAERLHLRAWLFKPYFQFFKRKN